jgi:hypothetical protein
MGQMKKLAAVAGGLILTAAGLAGSSNLVANAADSTGVCCLAPSGPPSAAPARTPSAAAGAAKVLTFEGLQNLEPVANFYSGGTGGNGSGPRPEFGITFSSNALAIIDSDAGGSGNFGGEPSSSTTVFFTEGASATMTVSAGFQNGFPSSTRPSTSRVSSRCSTVRMGRATSSRPWLCH